MWVSWSPMRFCSVLSWVGSPTSTYVTAVIAFRLATRRGETDAFFKISDRFLAFCARFACACVAHGRHGDELLGIGVRGSARAPGSLRSLAVRTARRQA